MRWNFFEGLFNWDESERVRKVALYMWVFFVLVCFGV
jgi:hypothetical protein